MRKTADSSNYKDWDGICQRNKRGPKNPRQWRIPVLWDPPPIAGDSCFFII
ncbi:hypothetical protein CLOSTASPAR_04317 [[Clostridium] asparagiforme DSM 15981]|uniref:Uncharacterized protein n=1 Tax=[Clostridium] asparagiforme DSM 15981 TaxID=518636 RepID=C0D4X1_9FIRM|nr:hypothetical protein CLOSTASPAR_04317 [[Clostridium] asparagiforme DSM 15981]